MLGLGDIRKLCTPAYIYFLVSIMSLFMLIGMNMKNSDTLCVGNYECPVDNLLVVFLIKAMYIIFMTIVLDSLCKNGYANISWFLVFFPILFYFVALGGFMIMQNSKAVKHRDVEHLSNLY